MNDIKDRVVKVNQEIYNNGLVILTWGNASAISDDGESVFIKPSGVPFKDLKPFSISEISLVSGKRLSGLKPSVDTDIHLEIYKNFDNVGGVIHTHSNYATSFAQAKVPIPYLGTTHADYFYGDVPVVADLDKEEIFVDYEKNIGKGIVNYFKKNNIDHKKMPATLIPGHGSVVWGKTVEEALENAIVLEEVAKLAFRTLSLSSICDKMVTADVNLLDKHFFRKHGKDKYYGQ